MSKPPTISDVARAAGVSVASVSRVLSGSTAVTDELQERIVQAVQETGYKPQRVHKGAGKTQWLPVVTGERIQAFDLEVIAGIQEQAEARGLQTMIIRLTSGKGQLVRVLRQMRTIPQVGMVALNVWLGAEEWLEAVEEAKTPLVLLNMEVNHPKVASILVDFEAAAAQATQHLLDLGHTRILYLTDMSHPVAAAQWRGIQAALGRRGLEDGEEYRTSVPLTAEGVSQGISRMMRLPVERRPTAVFAFDDEVAIDALNALRYYGLRVPEDISVVGFDNIPMAAHTYPPLTTVDVPKRRMGRQMVNLLEGLARNEGGVLGSMILEAQLIVRGSTGRIREG